MRFAVVGIGNMGSAYALSIHNGQASDGVLTAVCDIAPSHHQWADETLSLDTVRYDALLAQKAAASSYHPDKVTAEADGAYKVRWNVNW